MRLIKKVIVAHEYTASQQLQAIIKIVCSLWNAIRGRHLAVVAGNFGGIYTTPQLENGMEEFCNELDNFRDGNNSPSISLLGSRDGQPVVAFEATCMSKDSELWIKIVVHMDECLANGPSFPAEALLKRLRRVKGIVVRTESGNGEGFEIEQALEPVHS